jgi:hypothetical protein
MPFIRMRVHWLCECVVRLIQIKDSGQFKRFKAQRQKGHWQAGT